MSDHKCACMNCDPGLAPSGDQEGPHHVAARFKSFEDKNEVYVIRLNGVEQRLVVEAVAGPRGRIFRYQPCSVMDPSEFPSNISHIPDGPHLCKKCELGACAVWEFGDVEIECNGVKIEAPASEPAREEVNV